ncbi:hypothetical protein J6590_031403 [Homalodisca vitripennis]|nr:hypothetical protein J6590_031403 [Homalodisca vitripennis]
MSVREHGALTPDTRRLRLEFLLLRSELLSHGDSRAECSLLALISPLTSVTQQSDRVEYHLLTWNIKR